MHRHEDLSPIFIVGSGRSGNTLMRRILQAHPKLHIPPETFVLGDVIRLFRRNSVLSWDRLAHLVLGEFGRHPDFGHFNLSLEEVRGKLVAIETSQRSLARIIDAFYSAHAEVQGKSGSRWGDKTPINTFVMERIRAVFPKVQFVCMLRDGVDVVASYLESGIYNDVGEAAGRWLDAVEAVEAFSAAHPECCLEVRYESLVASPDEQVRRVTAFLGEEYDPVMISKTEHVAMMGDAATLKHHARIQEPIDIQSVGKGRRGLDTERRRALMSMIGKKLTALGYRDCLEARADAGP